MGLLKKAKVREYSEKRSRLAAQNAADPVPVFHKDFFNSPAITNFGN